MAVTGLGGVGKTRLGIEYAYRYAKEYELIAWLRGESAELLQADLIALAPLLGLADLPRQEDAVAAVRQSLSRSATVPLASWLLVIDNVEDLRAVRDLLPADHAGHVLVTTRHGDWRSIPTHPVVSLGEDDAVIYLTDQAHITAEEARPIARALGGLPLALGQAAGVIDEGMHRAHMSTFWQGTGPLIYWLRASSATTRKTARPQSPGLGRLRSLGSATPRELRPCSTCART